jgi:hypothetical protein
MITETEFSAGLARVSQVRSGYNSGNWVKAFSLFGGDRISRVRLGYGSGKWVKLGYGKNFTSG